MQVSVGSAPLTARSLEWGCLKRHLHSARNNSGFKPQAFYNNTLGQASFGYSLSRHQPPVPQTPATDCPVVKGFSLAIHVAPGLKSHVL